jgi:hypothetical protein
LAFETSSGLTVAELVTVIAVEVWVVQRNADAGEESPIALVDLDDISFDHQEAPKSVTISGSGQYLGIAGS